MKILNLLLLFPLLISPVQTKDIPCSNDELRYKTMEAMIYVGVMDEDTQEYLEVVVENKYFYRYMTTIQPNLTVNEYAAFMMRHSLITASHKQLAVSLTGIKDPKKALLALNVKHVITGAITFETLGVENEVQLLGRYFQAIDEKTYLARDTLKDNPDVIGFLIDLGFFLIRDDFTGKICLIKP